MHSVHVENDYSINIAIEVALFSYCLSVAISVVNRNVYSSIQFHPPSLAADIPPSPFSIDVQTNKSGNYIPINNTAAPIDVEMSYKN